VADSTTQIRVSVESVFFVAVKTLVEDDELKRLRAMADGSRPFKESGLWERLAALDLKEIMRLPARERLGVGYYTAAQRRAESLKA
jgi:hypothetical protein